MGTMATVRVNTTQQMILYRDFIIQEALTKDFTAVWEWAHQDYDHVSFPVAGDCQTVFECIDAIDEWHESSDVAPAPASQKENA